MESIPSSRSNDPKTQASPKEPSHGSARLEPTGSGTGGSLPEAPSRRWAHWFHPRHWASDPTTPRFAWVLVGIYLFSTAVLSFAEFYMERSRERQRIDATMQAAGYALDQILGRDFHDRYTSDRPIASADYARLVQELNRFARHLRVEYVYSVVRSEGEVFFVVSNETRDDSLRGTPSRFYNPYPKPPAALLQAFDSRDETGRYASYTNIWDSFYSVFIPRWSPGGVRYILAADIKLDDYRTLLASCLGRSAFLVFVLLVPLLPLVHLQRKFVRARMEIAERNRAHAADLAELNSHLESMVSRRTAELEQALEDLKRFSYTVSHDLNAPLHAISGFSQILKDEVGQNLSEEHASFLGTISASASRMSTMIKTILYQASHHDTPLRKETVDLSEMAGEVVDELRAASMGFGAQVEIAPSLSAHGDPPMVRLILQNLLSNAFKYSRNNPAPRVVLAGGAGPAEDWFEVRDNGAGFPPELETRLFRPFGRLHGEEFEGFGIGLSHVARIVEDHGGTITASGRPNEGAAFRVVLPRSEKSGAGDPEEESSD
ncbi:MAG: hypothetical protein IPO40_07170 [Fibrobacteres bacterium]|nr:hypothetical protein [Fibrobacterota bacterium]